MSFLHEFQLIQANKFAKTGPPRRLMVFLRKNSFDATDFNCNFLMGI